MTSDRDSRLTVKKAKVSFWEEDVDGLEISQFACSDGDPSKPMIAVVGKVGSRKYLMVTTQPDNDPGPWFAAQLHLVFTYELDEDGLTLRTVSPERVDELWKKHRFGLDFLCYDDASAYKPRKFQEPCGNDLKLLTGTTKVLRDFLVENSSDSRLFGKIESYVRLDKPECRKSDNKKEGL